MINKSRHGAFFALLLCLFSIIHIPVASAITVDDITNAADSATDKSRQALVTIFGEVVNNPLATGNDAGSDTLIAAVFKTTNSCLLAVAGFMACYMMFRKVMQSAHDGSMFDRSNHIAWGPVRMLLGISMMVPTANGWCLSQLLMLWAASQMGIGIANIGTNAALDAFANGQSMIMQPVSPNTEDLARSLYESNLCRYGVNASLDAVAGAGGYVTDDDYINQDANADSSGFILKSKYYVCGGANATSADNSASATSTQVDTSAIRQAHIDALANMQAQLSIDAESFVQAVVARQNGSNATLPNTQSAIMNAARVYENTMTSALRDQQSVLGQLANAIGDQIREQGWFSLGSWYQTFAEANTNMGNAAASKGQAFGKSTGTQLPVRDLYDSTIAAYTTQQSTQSNADVMTAGSSFNTGDTEGGIMREIFHNSGQSLTTSAINAMSTNAVNQVNPLITMKGIGDYIVGAADTVFGTYMIANVAAEGFSGTIYGAAMDWFTGAPSAVKAGLTAISPFIFIIVIALFTIGTTLSIYIPFAPFIIWFTACINWLVIVGEAVIAAPLWSMTHLHTDGEGMGQKTTHGYIFLLNVMVRPILMVIGFFLGGAIVQVGGTFLNSQLASVIANSQFDSMSGIVSFIWWIFIYCSICISLINSSFSLIHIVPDQVINWVGGYAAPNMGRDTASNANNAMNQLGSKTEGGIKEGLAKSPSSGGSDTGGNKIS
jgi:conjugal transfer/type IV secretion protein DotA/TraY